MSDTYNPADVDLSRLDPTQTRPVIPPHLQARLTPQLDQFNAARAFPDPDYGIITLNEEDPMSDAWLALKGQRFRLRREVSGRVAMKRIRGSDGDTFEALRPFVVPEELDRLLAACDDEDNPVTMAGASKVAKQLVEKYLNTPLP